MKNVLALFIIATSLNFAFAQKKLKSIETYDMKMGFEETKKQFTANFDVTKELILEDGSKVVVGQEMKLGESVSKISNDFESIFMGKLTLGGALLSTPARANKSFNVYDYIVEEIKVKCSMGIVSALFYLKNTTTDAMGLRYITATNMSLENGEALNPNRLMTREEAITKLKEAKDLLDLEMMTQEEYDALRKKLTPIIRGDN